MLAAGSKAPYSGTAADTQRGRTGEQPERGRDGDLKEPAVLAFKIKDRSIDAEAVPSNLARRPAENGNGAE